MRSEEDKIKRKILKLENKIKKSSKGSVIRVFSYNEDRVKWRKEINKLKNQLSDSQ